ncbi:MAG: hypothetical protein B7Y32_08715, partial [Methylophilales bacterium 16-45-7]
MKINPIKVFTLIVLVSALSLIGIFNKELISNFVHKAEAQGWFHTSTAGQDVVHVLACHSEAQHGTLDGTLAARCESDLVVQLV